MGSKKQLTTIIGAAAVIVLGGAIFLYTQVKKAGDIWPYENAPGTLSGDIRNLNREIQRLREEEAKIEPAKERLAKIKEEYELALRVLPSENSPDQLIAAIRTKAQQVGVVPNRLVPSAARGGSRRNVSAFEEWSFSLTINGTYDEIASFINRMEEFESSDPSRTGSERRFFQVSDISIRAVNSGMGLLGQVAPEGVKAKHECSLVMQTYRFTGEE